MWFFALISLIACDPPSPYGAYASGVEMQQDALAANPCNLDALRRMVDLMESAGYLQDAVPAVTHYGTSCSPDSAFEDWQLDYAIRAQQWPMALSIADGRVAKNPTSTLDRTTRARVREQSGDLQGAVVDSRQAVLLSQQKSRSEPLKRLAQRQERAGQPCAAWSSWNLLSSTDRNLRGEAQLAARRLSQEPACLGMEVEGEATFTRGDRAGWWLFPVTLDGQPVELGVDTSAATSVLSRATTESLGLKGDGKDWYIYGFAGILAGPMHSAAMMDVAGIKVPNVDFVIVEELPDKLPGLLGADVLSRISFHEERGKQWKVVGK